MLKDLSIITPKNKSIINNKQPEISLVFLDRAMLNDIKSIKMYLNKKEVSLTIKENKIIYTPKKSLRSGKYRVKIKARYSNGDKKDFEWSFAIASNNTQEIPSYNFYYGIPHAHTCLSTGKGSPTEALNYAQKKNLDFLAITDHCGHLNKKATYKGSNSNKWDVLKMNVANFNKNHNKFLGLSGFEVTSNNYGDFNVFNSDNIFRGRIRRLSDFLFWLEREGTPIVAINHPHKYIESLTYNEHLDKFINLIEVGNGSFHGKYLDCERYYYKLLDKGWHLGAINGQDNHKFDWGDSDNLTVVLSPSLKKDDLLDSLKNRRTYSTETRALKLLFNINNYPMGSIIKNCGKNLDFTIWAEDKKSPMEKIQIITNEGKVIKEKNFHGKTKIKWNFSMLHIKNQWYVAKVIHQNGRCGISSAIFV